MNTLYHGIYQLPLFATKVCPNCHMGKPLDDFYKRGPSRGGKPGAWCKVCTNEHRKLKRIQNIQNPPEREILTSLVCKQCGTEKSINAFYVDPLSARGYRATCKDCVDKGDPRTKNRGSKRNRRNRIAAPGHKWCWACDTEKPLSGFARYASSPDGYQYYCNDCLASQRREKWPKIREEVLAQNYARYQTISDEERERRNGYSRKNSQKPRARMKTAEKSRRRTLRKKETQTDPVDYPVILERDGAWCYLCERDIDLTLRNPHPARLTFDHVVPLNPRPGEPQGTHQASNIKPAHYVCNMRKSNKRLEDMTPHQRRGPGV